MSVMHQVAGWRKARPRSAVGGDATDAALIAMGDAGFGVLFDRHGRDVYRYFSRRVGADLAEDLTSETFLVAFEKRDRYDTSHPHARPWLYGIATNLVRRHHRVESANYRALARAGSDPLAGTVDNPDQRAAERADAAALTAPLAAALAAMPDRQRDVVLLFAAGLSYPEIAAALNVSQGTIQSRLHRSRAKLRVALEPYLKPSSGDSR